MGHRVDRPDGYCTHPHTNTYTHKPGNEGHKHHGPANIHNFTTYSRTLGPQTQVLDSITKFVFLIELCDKCCHLW